MKDHSKESKGWSNWSGSVRMHPGRTYLPRDVHELCHAVRGARRIKVVGAGHSFAPLCETEGALLDLSGLDGTLELSATGDSAWVPAGWTLERVSRALWDAGYSLANQGDINTQSIAGLLATGTHGTGQELQCLSALAREFQMVLADGELVTCSPTLRPALFEAQRVSLGMLGVVVRARLAVMPAYGLQERIESVAWNEIVETYDQLALENRHAEFWVFPYSDQVMLKTMQPTAAFDEADKPQGPETLFRFVCETTAQYPETAAPLQQMLTSLVRSRARSGASHAIFPTQRTVRFEELEYEVPRAAGLAALEEARRWIRKRSLPVAFPFEYRCTAGDDIWLSPFNLGPVANISAHQYFRMPWEPLFKDLERIFRAYGGRPHWAKRHSLSADDVFELYPRAADFCAVRAAVDPESKFVNRYLSELFALDRAR